MIEHTNHTTFLVQLSLQDRKQRIYFVILKIAGKVNDYKKELDEIINTLKIKFYRINYLELS